MAFTWASAQAGARRVVSVSLVTSICVLSGWPARAQVGGPTESGWATAVDRYLAGDLAGTASVLAALTPEDIRSQSEAAAQTWLLDATRARPTSEARRVAVRRIQAAALVPLEVLLGLARHEASGPRAKALQVALTQAWRPLTALTDTPRLASPSLVHFYLWSKVGYFQALLNAGHLYALEGVARNVQPPDDAPAEMRAEFFLLRGMAEERMARLAASSAAAGQTFDVPGAQLVVPSRAARVSRSLAAATSWYELAAELAPAHDEVRTHLGRTLIERQQPEAAIRVLAPLTDVSCTSTWCALAQLFTAEAHELAGRLPEASNGFARAAGPLSTRQSALVALMRLSVQTADPSAGITLTSQLLTTSPLRNYSAPDAWSEYISGIRKNSDAVLRPMREALLP
jgi:hypothetical protein